MPPKVPKPTLVIDTREKLPWKFDGDDKFESVKVQKLDYGDYALEGLEHIVCIERKANANELFQNFTTNKERLFAEMERMQACKLKFIVVEQTLEQLLYTKSYFAVTDRRLKGGNPRYAPAVVVNGLQEIMMRYGVHVIFGGKRAKAMARGLLLKAYDLYRKGLLDEQGKRDGIRDGTDDGASKTD